MSCSDCKKVGDMIHAVMDDEVTCEELKAFNEHLENCTNCSSHVEKERVLFDQIKAKMQSKCCPQNVLNSVMDKIQQLIK